jgi:hypothetical protein
MARIIGDHFTPPWSWRISKFTVFLPLRQKR